MATTLTPRNKAFLGQGLAIQVGDYATDGSSAITITIPSGYVISIEFFDANQNTLDAGTTPAVALTARSTSGSTTTYTLTPSGGAVTGGTYMFIFGGV